MNLASRLESNARPNQILISEDTFLLIRDSILCDKLDKITVKNIKYPIQTYEVRGALGSRVHDQKLEEQSDGFSLFMDCAKIDEIDQKRELLQKALSLLDSLENE